MEKEKNKPMLKLMGIVLREDEWQSGDTSRFAKAFSKLLQRKVSRQSIHTWLMGGGIPAKHLQSAITLSHNTMTAQEFRPDLYN